MEHNNMALDANTPPAVREPGIESEVTIEPGSSLTKKSFCLATAACILLGSSVASWAGPLHRNLAKSPASTARISEADAEAGAPAATVFVHTQFGGEILGYDIDRNGTEGILTEFVALSNGKSLVAAETFDQKTGKIVKVVAKINNTNDDFVTFGVFGKSVGLVEHEHSDGQFVSKRTFDTLNPLDVNKFNGVWTPPLKKNEIVLSTAETQGFSTTPILAFENGGNFDTFLFTSNVGGNAFGPRIALTDPNFVFSHAPLTALDAGKNQAVLGTGGSDPFGPPTMALANLARRKVSEFQGLGVGMVNGIAVDPANGVACTATSIDFSVEFYDSRKKFGFLIETLPGANNQLESAGDVEFDPIHKLFLVEQYTSNGNINDTQPRVYVYDEKGNLKNSIGGFTRIPISPIYIALNPSARTGFLLLDNLTELQSFKY